MLQHMTLEDGTQLNSPQKIHEEAVKHFQFVLNIEGVHHIDTWKDLFQTVITDEDNDSLCQSPSFEEIKIALFNLPKDNTLGPDDFSSCFFMKC